LPGARRRLISPDPRSIAMTDWTPPPFNPYSGIPPFIPTTPREWLKVEMDKEYDRQIEAQRSTNEAEQSKD
jgi:hypothetical protein